MLRPLNFPVANTDDLGMQQQDRRAVRVQRLRALEPTVGRRPADAEAVSHCDGRHALRVEFAEQLCEVDGRSLQGEASANSRAAAGTYSMISTSSAPSSVGGPYSIGPRTRLICLSFT